jgi:hypothetical protein
MDTSDLELKDRYYVLMKKYTALAPELARKLEEFGRLRKELQLIVVELKERKIEFEE